jgi:hypothetical protein
MKKHLSTILILASLSLACHGGSGGGGGGGGVNAGGEWSGTWTSSDGAQGGFASMSLRQSTPAVTGSAVLLSFPWGLGGGAFAGELEDQRLSGQIENGDAPLTITGAVLGDTLALTYTVGGGPGAGQTGSIEATRVLSPGQGADDGGPILTTTRRHTTPGGVVVTVLERGPQQK